MSTTRLDEALLSIGKYGRYQLVASIIITLVGTWFPAWHMMGIIFSADRPAAYRCTQQWSAEHRVYVNNAHPPGSSTYAATKNISSDLVRIDYNGSSNASLSSTEADCIMATLQANGSAVADIPCAEWQYSTLYNESTIVTDLDLVCDREILAETSQSIFLLGMLVGSVAFGYLSDAFGRKIVLLGACLGNALFGIAVSYVWSYLGVVTLWFLVGMSAQGYNQVQFVMIMEMFPPGCRTLAGSLNNLFWGLGIVTITPIAYALRNWRHMQLATSASCLVAIPLWPILDESVRWLLAKGRISEAQRILNKMARWNGVTPPCGGFVLTQEETHGADEGIVENGVNSGTKPPSAQKLTFLDVLRSRRVLVNICIIFIMWFVSLMTYYGTSLNSSHLAGNKYANFLFLALAEIPGYIIIHFTMTWWGRRPSLGLFFLVSGLASIATACLPEKTGWYLFLAVSSDGTDLTVAIIVAAMLVKLCIVCAYSINLICCTEVLPTQVRNMGFGVGAVFGNVGTAIAPFVLYLDEFASYLPLSICGGLCILSALLVPILPETRNKPLPETLQDAVNIGRKLATSKPAAPKRTFKPVEFPAQDDLVEDNAVESML